MRLLFNALALRKLLYFIALHIQASFARYGGARYRDRRAITDPKDNGAMLIFAHYAKKKPSFRLARFVSVVTLTATH